MKIELPLYFNKVGSLPWESYLRVILRFTPEIDSRVNVIFFFYSEYSRGCIRDTITERLIYRISLNSFLTPQYYCGLSVSGLQIFEMSENVSQSRRSHIFSTTDIECVGKTHGMLMM